MLIIGQRPNATQVAGFQTWRKLGRAVKKGAKGIAIFAPMKIKPRPTSGQGSDEEDRPPQLRFRVVHVFDISQTEGDALPEPVRVSGDPRGVLSALEAAIRAEGIDVEDVDDLGGADGVSKGGTIQIVSGLEPAERFSALVHEWAHEKLHKADDPSKRASKVVRETEAEAVAFVVSRAIGLDTSTASADYIRLYSGDTKTLAGSLDRIQQTAYSIIEVIDEDAHSHQDRIVEAKLIDSARQR